MNKIYIYLFCFLLLPVNVQANDKQVNYIVIEGNKRVASSEIIDYSGIEIGKVYTKNEISVLIKNLFTTNLFKNIKINLENNTAYIDVIERPIISRILIEGNSLLETEQIINSLMP